MPLIKTLRWIATGLLIVVGVVHPDHPQGVFNVATGQWSVGGVEVARTETLTLWATVDSDQLGKTITNRTTRATSAQIDQSNIGDNLDASVQVLASPSFTADLVTELQPLCVLAWQVEFALDCLGVLIAAKCHVAPENRRATVQHVNVHHRGADIDQPEPTAEPADKEQAEIDQALGDPRFVHQKAHEDEQRQRHQRVGVEAREHPLRQDLYEVWVMDRKNCVLAPAPSRAAGTPFPMTSPKTKSMHISECMKKS